MRIRVTQRDVDEGVQNNSFHCPVARAVRRALGAGEVWVREIIIVTKSGSRDTYVTVSRTGHDKTVNDRMSLCEETSGSPE